MHWSKRNQIIRLLTYFCLITFVVVLSRRYFMIRASVEESAVRLAIRNIRLVWPYYYRLQALKQPSPSFSNIIKGYLKELGISYRPISTPSELAPRQWGYDETHAYLIYHVENKFFFREKDNMPFIRISFVRKQGKLVTEINNYQWCASKAWWGCKRWSIDTSKK